MEPSESLLADGRGHYTRKELVFRMRDFVQKQPGVTRVELVPSRISPRIVVATIDTSAFLGRSDTTDTATLEIEYRPRARELDGFRIQWIESEGGFSCGWHQDETHPELGRCHFQVDRSRGVPHRESASFTAEHPLGVVAECFERLPDWLREKRL